MCVCVCAFSLSSLSLRASARDTYKHASMYACIHACSRHPCIQYIYIIVYIYTYTYIHTRTYITRTQAHVQQIHESSPGFWDTVCAGECVRVGKGRGGGGGQGPSSNRDFLSKKMSCFSLELERESVGETVEAGEPGRGEPGRGSDEWALYIYIYYIYILCNIYTYIYVQI